MFKKNILKKKYFYIFLFIIFIIFFGIFIFNILVNNNTDDIVKCNMKFALCPAAKCVPNPYDNSKAYCFCDVVNGKNYSFNNNNCNNINPYYNEFGEEIIFSDFSPIIKKMGYHNETCPPDTINLNCMNKICSVYPNDPSKALCICDKTDNKGINWVTYNKNGESKTCNYQSGSTSQQHDKLSKFIKENP
jgi:hypothetical protein